jgi:cysteine desulfurase / selenocysteine lyase
MKSNRRQFLSTCAAAGVIGPASIATGEAQNVEPQMWPSPFPALRQRVNEHPLSFLDSAATTLRPQSVIDALVEYYSTDNANPSPVHTLASRAANRLSGARPTLARFVNATDPTEIIFMRGTRASILSPAARRGRRRA